MPLTNPTVPASRTITINGVAQDLSADRTWTVSASAADANPNLYVTNADVNILANYSIIYAAEYEVGSGDRKSVV